MENDIYQKSLNLLRENKVRITPQRQIILKYLIDHDNHPSVETIYKALEDEFSNLSVATIYNNLELFEKLGIIIQIPNQDGGVRYDFFGTPHFHAICENCGKIVDIFYPKYKEIDQELKNITKNQSDFMPSTSRIEVYGLCNECKKQFK